MTSGDIGGVAVRGLDKVTSRGEGMLVEGGCSERGIE